MIKCQLFTVWRPPHCMSLTQLLSINPGCCTKSKTVFYRPLGCNSNFVNASRIDNINITITIIGNPFFIQCCLFSILSSACRAATIHSAVACIPRLFLFYYSNLFCLILFNIEIVFFTIKTIFKRFSIFGPNNRYFTLLYRTSNLWTNFFVSFVPGHVFNPLLCKSWK